MNALGTNEQSFYSFHGVFLYTAPQKAQLTTTLRPTETQSLKLVNYTTAEG